jgi:hypothetical protein
MVNNTTSIVDRTYFDQLAKKDSKALCRQTPCKYDEENKKYTISVWGDDYNIYPHEFKIDCIKKGYWDPHEFFYLFIIYYLLNFKDVKIKNEWISEKDIPGGTTFFRGPHEIPTSIISKQYKNDINAFSERCIELGGDLLDLADSAYGFNIVPQIPIAVLYWEGDEDFFPEAKILYDKTMIDYLPSDILFSLAVEVCARIGNVSISQ